jgi:hypothetical protein
MKASPEREEEAKRQFAAALDGTIATRGSASFTPHGVVAGTDAPDVVAVLVPLASGGDS